MEGLKIIVVLLNLGKLGQERSNLSLCFTGRVFTAYGGVESLLIFTPDTGEWFSKTLVAV